MAQCVQVKAAYFELYLNSNCCERCIYYNKKAVLSQR